MTPPGGAELVVLLVIAALFVGFVAGVVLLIKRVAGGTETKTAKGGPEGQRPPPGYWWDGEKWNSPSDQ
jgi:hypothetical protein